MHQSYAHNLDFSGLVLFILLWLGVWVGEEVESIEWS